MNEINEKDLEFVARHYESGKLNVENAWQRYLMRTGRGRKMVPHYKAIAASVALVLGLSVALAYNWTAIFHPAHTEPSQPQTTEVVKNTTPHIEKKNSTVVLKYDNEPIGKILTELSSYYGKTITTDHPDRRVSGELEASSLEEIVDILEMTLSIKIDVR